jgi:hypothetical protein
VNDESPEEGRESRGPELRFGAPTEQEVERSRNLKLILVALVGPFAILTYLGYHEAAVTVLVTSFVGAFYLVRVLDRVERLEDDSNATEISLRDKPEAPRPLHRTKGSRAPCPIREGSQGSSRR